MQELLQDVFAFTGLTTLFVNIGDALSGLAHAAGACLFMALLTQVGAIRHTLPLHGRTSGLCWAPEARRLSAGTALHLPAASHPGSAAGLHGGKHPQQALLGDLGLLCGRRGLPWLPGAACTACALAQRPVGGLE